MISADMVYGLLLRAYPKMFRAEFGLEMAQAFRDRRRDAVARPVKFWWSMLSDIARSAPTLRMDELRVHASAAINFKEGKMKTMAILALLIGALEALNSAAEAWVGGVVLHGGSALASGGLGTVAGLLLVISAIAMLRRSPSAAAFARGSAVACLAVFASVTLISPRFSAIATILGICFPVALLLYFRASGTSAPRMA
jgi:hypothetical protein